ncbi:CotD family spore coat protein [Alkalihalobacillus trypoxylicola]|nr:CotD family spore coat protein [Alkalihalobacillus trypoxylicola]
MYNYNRHTNCKCQNKQHCQCGYPQPKPVQQLPTKTMPAQQSPINQITEHVIQDVHVPMIHPTQTTQVNHTNYKYFHSYPNTVSVVNSVSEEHYCVCPPKNHCKPKWC